jgi:transcription-repair coupling factor (superfamily II helicase)
MYLNGLVEVIRSTPAFRELVTRLKAGERLGDLGVLRAARPYVLAALAREWDAPLIYVTARIDRAYNVAEQLPVWLGDDVLIDRFAEPAPFFYERAPWGDATIQARIETLNALAPMSDAAREPLCIVTSARAVMQRTLPVSVFRQHTQTLKVGQRHSIEKLIPSWLELGYEPTTIVVSQGAFSRRGGIIDVFPMASAQPVRIEFFDDEIESLRLFDVNTQRSSQKCERTTIPPAREALPSLMPPLAQHLAAWFADLRSTDADPTSPQADFAGLSEGSTIPTLEHYLPYVYQHPISLLDYAPTDALIIVEDREELRASVHDIMERAEHTRAERLAANVLAPDHPLPYLGWDALDAALSERQTVYFGNALEETAPLANAFRGLIAPEARFGGQLKMMLSQARTMRDAGDSVIAVSAQAARLSDVWREQETSTVALVTHIPSVPQAGSITFVDGTLQEGWRLRTGAGDVHLFSDAEIFGWSRPEPRRRQTQRKARLPELNYSDLHEGDYVVHVDYGVGRFAGMRRRKLEGIEREYLMLEYAGTDAVFVPIHQTDRVTRYVGPDDKPPTLSKLGQADWSKVRSKAQKAVLEEAEELLSLYAARASALGHGFGVDTPWQHELEASFPFVETEDQLKAVRDVKADMETPHPMDRLICGDVGYGKTEVALRAAFKAVMDGKQVAVLVPTTILAEQHYDTFRRRMIPFPVRVETLSRFRTKQEQNATLEKLNAGDVDILIGTHRLLQGDVTFKNLGLVIIDEEQRFGVKHKEHLKQLRTQVDVLTLTATPIPRTLYMGLTGVRDISMIQTPPEERLPIITHVGTFDERLVRQAVMREIERGGQIFVVHNRVQSIDIIRERLERIVPEARIVIGHGQMDERMLESVMVSFANGEYDILIATSIIESGLDIPNANTLIVDRADWFGLAQLYQIRGRVGRSAQQAYAYFFHPATNVVSDDARARLNTLAEYTDLGAGYQIAMRDLELRGAGDILSTRQTGHVAAIGLHLYTQMLAQTVKQLKGGIQNGGRAPVNESAILLDLPLPAYLPTDWIPEVSLRLQIYRRIGALEQVEDVQKMREELRDRFGELPAPVDGILFQIEVKLMALAANATAVVQRSKKLEVRLPYLVESNRDLMQLYLGMDTQVTRTAVEITLNTEWRTRTLAVLKRLADNVRLGARI